MRHRAVANNRVPPSPLLCCLRCAIARGGSSSGRWALLYCIRGHPLKRPVNSTNARKVREAWDAGRGARGAGGSGPDSVLSSYFMT